MRLPRTRCSVRTAMVVIALVALNLAAGSATWNASPAWRAQLSIGIGNGRGFTNSNPDGSRWHSRGNAEDGYRDPRMIRPPRPSRLRSASPAIAGLAITLFALILASGRPRHKMARTLLLALIGTWAAVGLRWWWVLEGGSLPVDRLEFDMTMPEVLAITGPPLPESVREEEMYEFVIDPSLPGGYGRELVRRETTWIVCPEGSNSWLELKFDERDLLRAYPPMGHAPPPRSAYRALRAALDWRD